MFIATWYDDDLSGPLLYKLHFNIITVAIAIRYIATMCLLQGLNLSTHHRDDHHPEKTTISDLEWDISHLNF